MEGCIGLNRKVVSTVGPVLRILVSLCVSPINTSHNVSVQVLFSLRYDDNSDDDSFENGKK